MGKRGAVLTTALLLAASTAFSVWAAPFAARYTYSSAGYLFEKFSHPDSAPQQPDGLVDYIGDGAVAAYDQGQGARGQSYSWAAIAYGDALYVSTNYASLPQTLNMMDTILGETFDKDVMAAELKALYNGSFFYGEEDGANTGGVLVKFDVNTGEMKVLMSRATTGQACAQKFGIYPLVVAQTRKFSALQTRSKPFPESGMATNRPKRYLNSSRIKAMRSTNSLLFLLKCSICYCNFRFEIE